MSFAQRIFLAFAAFFSVLTDGAMAKGFRQLRDEMGKALPPGTSGTGEESGGNGSPANGEIAGRDALHLMAILQREGRFVDFIQEDIAGFSDADVGAAARAVHDGCRKAVTSCFTLVPVIDASEGSTVTVDGDAAGKSVTLTGALTGQAPFKGILCHKGWRVSGGALPQVSGGRDMTVVAPAEVEL